MIIASQIENHLKNASWIRKLFEEGQQMSQDGNGPVYDFSIGNPELEPPKKLKQALRDAASDPQIGLHRYMPNCGYQHTRQAVANGLRQECGVDFNAENIIMTVGAAGAVNVAIKALCDPGDHVIVSAPYFVEYTYYAENHGAKLEVVPSLSNFDLDLDTIAEKLTEKTRIVLINNPNNPTGVVYQQPTLNQLGEILKEASNRYGRPIYLLDDAPYRKLIFDMEKCPSIFTTYDNSLMGTSHSKDLGIPGERIGYLAISPNCTDSGKVADAAAFANRTLGYVNAPALLQRVIADLQRELIDLEWYRKKRDKLCSALTKFGYHVTKPGGAFYLFPKIPIDDDMTFINKLKALRVLVVPSFGFGIKGHFRIAYCVDDSVIDGALPVFEKVIKG